jgi:Flp pilus assembly pilin Flp
MKKSSGQTLSEYGLIAAIVALVSMPVLFLLGGNISAFFQQLVPHPRSAIQVAKSTPIDTAVTSTFYTPATSVLTSSQTDQSQPAKSALSSALEAQVLLTTIQTVGANGTTKLLTSDLHNIAMRMKAQGKLTEAEYTQITYLANQGHRLAQIEALIEEAAQQYGDASMFSNKKVQLDGKSYQIADLIQLTSKTSPEVQKFITLQTEVLQYTAFSNEASQKKVRELSDGIIKIADASSTAAYMAQTGVDYVPTNSLYTEKLQQLIESNPMTSYSEHTTKNSNGICSQGLSSTCQK